MVWKHWFVATGRWCDVCCVRAGLEPLTVAERKPEICSGGWGGGVCDGDTVEFFGRRVGETQGALRASKDA